MRREGAWAVAQFSFADVVARMAGQEVSCFLKLVLTLQRPTAKQWFPGHLPARLSSPLRHY